VLSIDTKLEIGGDVFAVRCLLLSYLGGLRTCKLCPPVLRHTLLEKGLEEVDIQVDIMDCLMLDVTASLGIANLCLGPRSLTFMTHPFFLSCSPYTQNRVFAVLFTRFQ